jgi:hypothetical protein
MQQVKFDSKMGFAKMQRYWGLQSGTVQNALQLTLCLRWHVAGLLGNHSVFEADWLSREALSLLLYHFGTACRTFSSVLIRKENE